MENLKKYFILSDNFIKDAYLKLEGVSFKTLIVINKKNKFLGTLTDGDIRRGILNGLNFDSKIFKFYNRKSLSTTPDKASHYLFEKKIDVNLVPVLNKQKKGV